MRKKFIIGIDLGGTNLKIALLDFKYRFLAKRTLNTRTFKSKNLLIKAIAGSAEQIIRDNQLNKDQILGIGLGLPGPIDARRGIVHFLPNIKGWKEVRLKAILRKMLGLSVFLDNDAKLMALAEYELGAARKTSCAVCLTLGTGVGGAIIVEGELLRGVGNAAGEIGHLPLNEQGPSCACGGRGCLEAYIGNQRILACASKSYRRKVSLEELSTLAGQHEPRALRIWSETGRHLGVALAAVTNLLNPDCIVIGGGVAGAGKILFATLKRVVAERAMSVQARAVKIVKAKMGQDAGMIGAAILVRRSLA
jgi:glucokinase